MSIHYRMAQADDLAVLAALRWNLCQDDDVGRDGRDAFVAAFCRQLPPPHPQAQIVHWLAWHGTQAVAVLSIVRVPKLPAPDDLAGLWGYLTNVYTLPAYRNRGVGSALLAAAAQWARAEALELLLVWPSTRSFPFYRRAGFLRGPDPLVMLWPEEDGVAPAPDPGQKDA